MSTKFYKYQATGNDFILIDNRLKTFDKNDTKLISRLCNRNFGIGADGLILVEEEKEFDFRMVYFNSDGKQSSMCGNGGRSIVSFAKRLNIIQNTATFVAIDGIHQAFIEDDFIKLKMNDVDEIKINNGDYILDTGSPHFVSLRKNVSDLDVKKQGSAIRNMDIFKKKGINVNFVEHVGDNTFFVRTYERGVESETLSCGTGVTAVAIAMHLSGKTSGNKIRLNTLGGILEVYFNKNESIYTDIWLCGPSELIFEGILNYNY